MDVYTAAFLASLTPQILVALIGGFIGANISSDIKLYGLRLTVLTAIIAIATAGVASEYMLYKWATRSIIGHFALGCLTGMVGMRLLDAIRLALPDFMHSLTDLAGKSTLDLVIAFFKKVKSLLGF